MTGLMVLVVAISKQPLHAMDVPDCNSSLMLSRLPPVIYVCLSLNMNQIQII